MSKIQIVCGTILYCMAVLGGCMILDKKYKDQVGPLAVFCAIVTTLLVGVFGGLG